MAAESPTRLVDTDGLLEHLLRAHLPVDALDLPADDLPADLVDLPADDLPADLVDLPADDLPADLVHATVRDLILRDLGEGLDTEVAEPERKSPLV